MSTVQRLCADPIAVGKQAQAELVQQQQRVQLMHSSEVPRLTATVNTNTESFELK
jgi:hypothetical protein